MLIVVVLTMGIPPGVSWRVFEYPRETLSAERWINTGFARCVFDALMTFSPLASSGSARLYSLPALRQCKGEGSNRSRDRSSLQPVSCFLI